MRLLPVAQPSPPERRESDWRSAWRGLYRFRSPLAPCLPRSHGRSEPPFALSPSRPRRPAQRSSNLPSVLPPPEFLANKTPLPDLLLKDKREDQYFTGFPAIGWDPESGFNYGAAVQWFDNGPADSPFFRYTPYRERWLVGATGSTGGSTRATIGYDRPYLGIPRGESAAQPFSNAISFRIILA